MIHDIPFADGTTPKQRNLAESHICEVGDMIELKDGVRLWVVHLTRDCDGTPLYELSADKHNTTGGTLPNGSPCRHHKWIGPYSKYSFSAIIKKCEFDRMADYHKQYEEPKNADDN